MFLGYGIEQKWYCHSSPKASCLCISRHATFLEHIPFYFYLHPPLFLTNHPLYLLIPSLIYSPLIPFPNFSSCNYRTCIPAKPFSYIVMGKELSSAASCWHWPLCCFGRRCFLSVSSSYLKKKIDTYGFSLFFSSLLALLTFHTVLLKASFLQGSFIYPYCSMLTKELASLEKTHT